MTTQYSNTRSITHMGFEQHRILQQLRDAPEVPHLFTNNRRLRLIMEGLADRGLITILNVNNTTLSVQFILGEVYS